MVTDTDTDMVQPARKGLLYFSQMHAASRSTVLWLETANTERADNIEKQPTDAQLLPRR